MPYVVNEEAIPPSMLANQVRVNWLVQALNVVVPLLEAASGTAQTIIYFGHKNVRVKFLKIVLDINTYLIGILELVYGFCLMYAVYIITKYLIGQQGNINKTAFVVHSASFGLFMLSVIVLDGFYAHY